MHNITDEIVIVVDVIPAPDSPEIMMDWFLIRRCCEMTCRIAIETTISHLYKPCFFIAYNREIFVGHLCHPVRIRGHGTHRNIFVILRIPQHQKLLSMSTKYGNDAEVGWNYLHCWHGYGTQRIKRNQDCRYISVGVLILRIGTLAEVMKDSSFVQVHQGRHVVHNPWIEGEEWTICNA